MEGYNGWRMASRTDRDAKLFLAERQHRLDRRPSRRANLVALSVGVVLVLGLLILGALS